MIDIKFLRENPDVVRASQKGRGEADRPFAPASLSHVQHAVLQGGRWP